MSVWSLFATLEQKSRSHLQELKAAKLFMFSHHLNIVTDC